MYYTIFELFNLNIFYKIGPVALTPPLPIFNRFSFVTEF